MACSITAAVNAVQGEKFDQAIGLSLPPYPRAPVPEAIRSSFEQLSQSQLDALVGWLSKRYGCQPTDGEEAMIAAFERLLKRCPEIFAGEPSEWLSEVWAEARNRLSSFASGRHRLEAFERLPEFSGDQSLVDAEVCVAPTLADNRDREEIGWLDDQVEWSRERIIEVLQRFRDRHGRPPRSGECKRINCLPSPATICRHFGSLHAAILAAGMIPDDLGRRTKRWGPVEAARACRWFRLHFWRWPDQTDIKRYPGMLPGVQAMKRYFGGTSAFQVGRGVELILAAAGYRHDLQVTGARPRVVG